MDMNTLHCCDEYGQAHLTAADMEDCRNQLTDLIIAPFNSCKAKGVGYNLSLSEMVYSITRNRLVPICHEAQETFFYLRPHETILALSYEYIKVSEHIAGSFHSRVRITAQGVGSISTTLDPGWKGMLLFSLNNPTRKKIKVILSSRVDGTIIPNPVITLVAWRTGKYSQDNEQKDANDRLTLHLDNPAMRIDIWAELASKPLRLFHNRQYQRFCNLVESLSPFESTPSQVVSWATSLLQLLTELRIAIEAKQSEIDIQSSLIRIEAFNDIPDIVKDRLDKLTKALKQKNSVLEYCRTEEYSNAIVCANREIQYQLLCDQVYQIHERISKQVPVSWHKSLIANIWYQFRKNFGVFFATAISVSIVLYGRYFASADYWPKLLLAVAPLVISIVYNLIKERE